MASIAPVLCKLVKTLANMELAKLATIGLVRGSGGGGTAGVTVSGQLLKTVSVGLSSGSWWTSGSLWAELGRVWSDIVGRVGTCAIGSW